MSCKNHIYHLLLTLCLFATSTALSAQNFWFKYIGLNDGLSSSQVNCIHKDSQGFIWLGTTAGLDRFDGVSVREFRSDYTVSSSLPDCYITSIQEDVNGMLWLKTSNGYVVMNPSTQTFDRSISQNLAMIDANLDPELIFFDKNKNLWVYDEGKAIYYYKVKQQLIYKMAFDEEQSSLPKGTVCGFCNTQEGTLVAYTNGRVACINGEQKKVVWVNDIVAKNTHQEEDYHIFCDAADNIWLYSDAHTYIFDNTLRTWYQSLDDFLSHWNASFSLSHDIVTGVSEDSFGNLWISTDRNGLLIIKPKVRRVLYHVTQGGIRGISTNNLTTTYVDDTNMLWVGTRSAGAAYYAPNLYMFDLEDVGDVYGISEAPNGGLWMATHGSGLVYKNVKDGTTTSYGQSEGLNDNMLSCVLAASDGTVWAGSNRFGLNHFTGNGVNKITAEHGAANALLDNNIQALAEDAFGNIWIATRKHGLQCYNPNVGKYSNFSVENGKLLSNYVTSLSTREGKLVAGTMNGIMIVNLNSNKVTTMTGTLAGDDHFTNTAITQVLLDSRGLIWVGTRDGLNVLDMSADKLATFSTKDGLPSNVICGIAEDRNHDLWVTTGKGVSRITIQATTGANMRYAFNLYSYGITDGLQGSEFNMGAIAATRSGNIYMGGQNGINWLHAQSSNKRKRALHVLFAQLIIDDQRIKVGNSYEGHVILSQTLNTQDNITIGSRANEVQIKLSTDDYNHAEHPRFIYQLSGVVEEWQPVSGDGYTLRLTNLKSGRHKLHVKALLDDGKTVSEEHDIVINVVRPWYLQLWFICLLVVVLAVICYGLYRFVPYVIGYYRERRRELSIFQRRQEVIDAAIQEVRTKIVGMIPQLGILRLETENGEQKEMLNELHQSARDMLQSLNQLKENQNILVNDEGIDTGAGITKDDDEMEMGDLPADLLIGDDGPVEKKPVEAEFLVSDEGIITPDGAAVINTNLQRHSIFIVEPDKDMLDFIQDCLKGNYNITTFTSTKKCWDALANSRPSLIMCSQDMPDISGSAFCEQLKGERTYERLPFILTTNGVLTQAEFQTQHITLMADDYIPSPYNLQSVIVRINHLIGIPVDTDVVTDDTLRGASAMTKAVNNVLIQTLDQYIRQNINRKDLSLEEMSKVIGTSQTMLFRKVESITGSSPTDYIRDIRLDEAAKLLESGYVTAAEAASALGFGNLPTFNRFFQAKYGVLPSEYAASRNSAKLTH